MSFDAAGAKAAGYSDEEIQAYLANQAGSPTPTAGSIAAPGSAYDPSAGGGQLAIGPIQTSIHTPQWLDRLMSGTGRGMTHTVNSLGNFIGAVPDSTMAEEKAIDKPLMATGTGKVGNLMGEAALTAPLGMGVGAAAGAAAPALAGPIAQGALQGATQGFATADPGERGLNTAVGGVAGAALPAAMTGAKKLIYGLSRTPSAQTLIDAGVTGLTPGQMNPGGPMNQFEQAGESIPGVKQIVEPAREAAEHQYQALIIQQGAAPGAKITPSSNVPDMLQQAYDSYGPLYDQAKGFPVTPAIMRTTGPDIPLTDAFARAAAAPGIPKKLQGSEGDWLADRLTQLGPQPDSGDLLDLRSAIRARGRMANLKTDIDSAHIATIAGRAENAVTGALTSQLPAAPLQALSTADANYGNYKIVENAVAASKDNLAGLTPAKLSQAIYNATPDPAYARGSGGNLRSLAQAGGEVFQNVSPPTGARVATLGLGFMGGLDAPHVAIPVGAGMLGLTGTQTGRSLAQGMTRPQLLAQALANHIGGAVPAPLQGAGMGLARGLSTGAAIPYVPAAGTAAAAVLAPKWMQRLPGQITAAPAVDEQAANR